MPDPTQQNNPADGITDALALDLQAALDAVGQQMEDRLRELVSVPVEYDGKKVIRSKPGEPPRHEGKGTGFPTPYVDSFRHVTTAEGDKVRTEAGSTDPRGAYFTAGTARMKPRPHAEKVRDEIMESGQDRILRALSSNNGA